MKSWRTGFALISLFVATPSQAAPMYVIDQNCKRAAISDCIRLSTGKQPPAKMTDLVGILYDGTSEFSGYISKCAPIADFLCVVAVDLPTSEEVRAMVAEGARQQREQWADWLKTLEDTGVVQRVAPPPSAKR